jgi:UDP-glucuronate decarboxylase
MAKIILITGVAGFLGFNLASKLLKDGHQIIGVDDFCTGQQKHVAKLKQNSGFSFIEQSITSPLLINTPIAQIYNLACPASPPMYQKMPLHTLNSCSTGILNLLNLACQHNAKFLQASTSEVYGDPSCSPQQESYWGNVNPIGPRSCYDEGKRFAESLIINYAQQYNLDVKIARIFNTYGPGMRIDDGRVVSNFIQQALTDQQLTIFGSGQQTRSLCYVDDLIEGLCRLMALAQQQYPGPVNLGNPAEITILKLAQTVCKLARIAFKPQILPLPQDDPARRCPDITLAKELLKWQPIINLSNGLQKTISFFAPKL